MNPMGFWDLHRHGANSTGSADDYQTFTTAQIDLLETLQYGDANSGQKVGRRFQ